MIILGFIFMVICSFISMAMMFLAGYIYANRDKDVIYLGKHIVLEKKKRSYYERI